MGPGAEGGRGCLDSREATWDERSQAGRLEEPKGGLGPGRAAGLSRDSVLGAACLPHTGGAAALKTPPLPRTGRPDPG